MNDFIIFDAEYTTWVGAPETDWGEDWQHREIFQFGALKIRNGKIVDEFNCLVKPKINPILSDIAVELTGVTNEVLNQKGISFNEVYNKFVGFCEDLTVYTYGTNGKDDIDYRADGNTIDENLEINNMLDYPRLTYKSFSYIIFNLAKEKNIEMPIVSSGKTAQSLGLLDKVMELSNKNPHNALYDCYSLYITWKYLNNK